MPLLKVEADKLSNNDLVAGVIEEIIDKEDLLAVLPFVKSSGKAYVYNRENVLADAAFIGVNAAVPEGATTFTEVTTTLKILAGDVDVDKFLQATESDTTDQKATQIAFKAKGLARKFRETLAIGNTGTNALEFNGLSQLVAGGTQTFAAGANGGALTMTMMDDLADRVPNGADVFIMRPGTLRAYRSLLRLAGGIGPVEMMIEDFGRPMLTHNGIPIIVNEFLPGDETQGTAVGTVASVYAARLNEVDGLHGLFGGNTAGIMLEDIGTVQDKDADRTRLKWYCGTALKSTKSLARLAGITNI